MTGDVTAAMAYGRVDRPPNNVAVYCASTRIKKEEAEVREGRKGKGIED